MAFYVISIIDKQTSTAPLPKTLNKSVVCNTTLLPAISSKLELPGIGVVVTSSTSALVSVSLVSDETVTVQLTEFAVVLPIIHPNTIAVVLLGTVYTVASVVTPAFVFNLNVFAIFLS
tara:strand:+ start:469 stop:822 length:354 start_codon:yes stop_codon:yes gene_type:complete